MLPPGFAPPAPALGQAHVRALSRRRSKAAYPGGQLVQKLRAVVDGVPCLARAAPGAPRVQRTRGKRSRPSPPRPATWSWSRGNAPSSTPRSPENPVDKAPHAPGKPGLRRNESRTVPPSWAHREARPEAACAGQGAAARHGGGEGVGSRQRRPDHFRGPLGALASRLDFLDRTSDLHGDHVARSGPRPVPRARRPGAHAGELARVLRWATSPGEPPSGGRRCSPTRRSRRRVHRSSPAQRDDGRGSRLPAARRRCSTRPKRGSW